MIKLIWLAVIGAIIYMLVRRDNATTSERTIVGSIGIIGIFYLLVIRAPQRRLAGQ